MCLFQRVNSRVCVCACVHVCMCVCVHVEHSLFPVRLHLGGQLHGHEEDDSKNREP